MSLVVNIENRHMFVCNLSICVFSGGLVEYKQIKGFWQEEKLWNQILQRVGKIMRGG